MKRTLNRYTLILLSGFLFSCNQHTTIEEFSRAERLMLSAPDSALHLLESIPAPEKMRRVDYATYCLLLTEAQDKNYYTFTSDSVIRVAAEYFLDKGDNHAKARVYYIWGRVHHELLHYLKAHECYLQAIPFAQKENNYPLLLRIHNQCGNLYRNRKLYDKALSSLHEALRYCRLADDQNNLPYCLRDIGRVYLFKGEMDSTLHYYQEALHIARQNEIRTAESIIYRELGVAYKAAGEYEAAIDAVKRSSDAQAIRSNPAVCLTLGSLYLHVDNPDSAVYYLDYARESTDPYISSGANLHLYKLAVQMGNYKDAVYYNELYTAQKDSLDALADKDELLNLAHRFEQEALKNDLELKHARAQRNYVVVLLLLGLALGGILIVYYRYRFRKEREWNEQQIRLQNEKRLRLSGEKMIKKNQEQITINQQQLETQEVQLDVMRKGFLEQEMILLEKDNQLLRLAEEKKLLSDRFFAQTQYRERIKLVKPGLGEIEERQDLTAFSMHEMNDLKSVLDLLYFDFTERLQQEYPLLNEQEITLCCLIKAGAQTGHLSELIHMTPNAVTKKKRQIMGKMNLSKEKSSLSDFVDQF